MNPGWPKIALRDLKLYTDLQIIACLLNYLAKVINMHICALTYEQVSFLTTIVILSIFIDKNIKISSKFIHNIVAFQDDSLSNIGSYNWVSWMFPDHSVLSSCQKHLDSNKI